MNKVEYTCASCGAIIKRKVTEAPPKSCNYCHTDNPVFTVTKRS